MSKLNVVAEPGKQDIVMTREMNAPRELVFRALTDPELVPQWWGDDSTTTIVDQMDVRMGGIWRYVSQDAEGNEFAYRGVYHEAVAPERVVYTFEWEGMMGHILLETVTLEELNGKTLITDTVVFQTLADRNGMLENGIETGAAASWDRMERLLATM